MTKKTFSSTGVAFLFSLTAMAATFPMFWYITDGQHSQDILWHIDDLILWKKNGTNPGYSYWYQLLWEVSGRSLDREQLRLSACLLLSMLSGLKVAITYLVIFFAGRKVWISLLATLFLQIHMPVNLYRRAWMAQGKIVSNYWHNSTQILVVPFAVLLFLSVIPYLQRKTVPIWSHLVIAALVLLTVGAKPNYILALLPAVALCALWVLFRDKSGGRLELVKRYWLRLLVLFGSTIPVLVVQYILTFTQGGTLNTSTGIGLFKTWWVFAKTFPLGVVESLFFPALITFLVWKVIQNRFPLILAWLSLAIAAFQFALFVEVQANGKLLYHGNWEWGMVVARYILDLVLAANTLKYWKTIWANRWRFVVLVMFIVEFAYGCAYLWQLMFLKAAYR